MSFYVNLSSSHSTDIHPQNYGGDFQVELAEPLHFDENDPWEVALAEMTYDAQGFPNIPEEYSEIKIVALNRAVLYDCTSMDMSITVYHLIKGDWTLSDDDKKINVIDRVNNYVLPKQYYTWSGFKAAVKGLGVLVHNKYFSYSVEIMDTYIRILYSTRANKLLFRFSPDLIKFLSLEHTEIESHSRIHNQEYNTDSLLVNYKQPILEMFPVTIPESREHSMWFEIKGYGRYYLPVTAFKFSDLPKIFDDIFKGDGYDTYLKLSFKYIEKDDKYLWVLKAECLKPMADIVFHFSRGFLLHLGSDGKWVNFPSNYKLPFQQVLKMGTLYKYIPTVNDLTYYTKFPYNYFPSPQAFCETLSSTIMNLANTYTDADPMEIPLFTIENIQKSNTIAGQAAPGKCIFTPHPNFTITIHPFILKLLHLIKTDTQEIGSAPVILPTATREFFNLFTNIIHSHGASGATNKLRVINNNSSLLNEKVMITFQRLYYQPVSQLSITNIQINITDHHTDLILPFQKEVTCLLHFRRCKTYAFTTSNNNNHFA